MSAFAKLPVHMLIEIQEIFSRCF